MKARAWLLALTIGVPVSVALFAQGLNMRTGAWEFSMTMQGAIPMDGAPPEMRAQIEAEMRKPQVFQSCVTAEDLKSLKLGKTDDSDDEDCKVVSSTITAAAGDVVRQCTGDMPRTETAHYEAPTPQSVKANISNTSATGTMTMVITGKWLAAKCSD